MKLMKLEKWDEPLGFSRNVSGKSPILRHALARFAGHRPPGSSAPGLMMFHAVP